MSTTVFDANDKRDHTKSLAFLDPNGGVSIQRYDTLKYKQFDKLTDQLPLLESKNRLHPELLILRGRHFLV